MPTAGSTGALYAASPRQPTQHDSSTDSDTEFTGANWIPWFCSLFGHEIFVEVEEEFIRDSFNLFGLKTRFSLYDRALHTMLGVAPTNGDFQRKEFRTLYTQTTDLYGMIHARYITTPKGLVKMRQKYLSGVFGRCPRVLCDQHLVLPIGLSEDLRQHRARVYCPMCQEVYVPRASATVVNTDRCNSSSSSAYYGIDTANENEDEDDPELPGLAHIDGAFFGPSFPHIFLLQFSTLIPRAPPIPYVPKIFGFRIRHVKSTIERKLECGEYGKEYSLPGHRAAS